MTEVTPDPQPDIEAAPVKLIPKPAPKEAPPARPLVIASVLDWAARMWLIDHDPADEHLFIGEAETAFERMVDEQAAAKPSDTAPPPTSLPNRNPRNEGSRPTAQQANSTL